MEKELKGLISPQNFFGYSDWAASNEKVTTAEKALDMAKIKTILTQQDPFRAQAQPVSNSHFLFYLPRNMNLAKLGKLSPNFKRDDIMFRDTSLEDAWFLGKIEPILIGQKHTPEEVIIPKEYEIPTPLQAAAMHILYFSKNQRFINTVQMGRTKETHSRNKERIIIGRFDRYGLAIETAPDEDSEIFLGTFVFRRID